MEREDVNELILDKVDEIEDETVRQFIDDILRFERTQLNLEQPHYKSDYNDYIDEYISDWEGASIDE